MVTLVYWNFNTYSLYFYNCKLVSFIKHFLFYFLWIFFKVNNTSLLEIHLCEMAKKLENS